MEPDVDWLRTAVFANARTTRMKVSRVKEWRGVCGRGKEEQFVTCSSLVGF